MHNAQLVPEVPTSNSMAKRPVALITGGSKGIGYGIALALGKRGYELCLLARNAADLETAALELRARCAVPVTTISADLSQPSSYQSAFEFISQTYQHLDVLVNNAGIFQVLPRASEHSLRNSPSEIAADVAAISNLNIVPPCTFAHVFRDLQLRAPHPKQLDVLSSAALTIYPGNNPYGLSKVAHERLSLTVTAETLGRIATYRVYPSNVDTPLVSQFSGPKLTAEYVGERSVAMLCDNSATDLFLKKTESGVVEGSGKLNYVTFLRDAGTKFDGLALVREHRILLEENIMPVVEKTN